MPGAATLPLCRNQKGLDSSLGSKSYFFLQSVPVIGQDLQGQEVSAPLLLEDHSLITFSRGKRGPPNTGDIKAHLPHALWLSAEWSFLNKHAASTMGAPTPAPLPRYARCRLTHISLLPILWWDSRRRETPTMTSPAMPSSACMFSCAGFSYRAGGDMQMVTHSESSEGSRSLPAPPMPLTW